MADDYSLTGNTRIFRRRDYLKITIFGFALTALWQSLHTIVLPLRLLDFVPETQKNTYLGLLTFAGLILAMLVQPLAGAISDHADFPRGKRRPFILLGTLAALVFLPGFGFLGSLGGIFIIYCLLQISTNTAQGPYQAFIPDMVPAAKRGVASGVKSFLEIAGGVALIYPVALLMDRYFLRQETRWLWYVLALLAVIMLCGTLATLRLVKEPVGTGRRKSVRQTLTQVLRVDWHKRHYFLWFLASRMLVFMAFTTIQQFALNYLRDVIGVANPAEATARFSIVAVGGMLAVVWPAGHFSDRIGRRPINIAASLLGAVGVAVIFFSRAYLPTILGAGIIGIAIGAFQSTNWALATDLLPEKESARYLDLANVATAGGAALARLIGPLIDFLNRQDGILGYQVMLLACIVYFTAGAALITRIRR